MFLTQIEKMKREKNEGEVSSSGGHLRVGVYLVGDFSLTSQVSI